MLSKQIQLVSWPERDVTAESFAQVAVELPDIRDGEVLVENTWTSVDPGMRLRLREHSPAGYFAAFPLNQAMDGIFAVGRVIESKSPDFPVGTTVWHSFGWRSHAIVKACEPAMNGIATLRKLDVDRVPEQTYLGVLGVIGLTAYSGLSLIDAIDTQGTIWVSAAAGAVGSIVCQIAKLTGLRVVASAGSDEKVGWLRDDVGVDAAFNWRDGSLTKSLSSHAPEGIDFYFDGVGGDHLEAALAAMNNNGKVALCGAISEYEEDNEGIRNLFLATAKNITLRGFRASAHVPLLDEMQRRLEAWYVNGELRYRETVYEGLKSAPTALADMMAGRTVGKTLVRI